MPEVIFLIGAAGTGKSTYIQSINNKSEYTVISSDDILEELGAADGISYADAFQKYVNFAGKEMFRRAKQAIKAEKNVIWDQTNMGVKTRKKKIEMFPDTYTKKAIVFGVSDQELKRRLKKREQETGKHIPDHVVKNMIRSYQPPSKAEGFSEIKNVNQ